MSCKCLGLFFERVIKESATFCFRCKFSQLERVLCYSVTVKLKIKVQPQTVEQQRALTFLSAVSVLKVVSEPGSVVQHFYCPTALSGVAEVCLAESCLLWAQH